MSKDKLLQAAAEEFARYGEPGARISAIVQRSGVNERMIYHHFGSKAGLYRAVIAAQWQALSDAWLPQLKNVTKLDPLEGLRQGFAAMFEILLQNPLAIPLAVHESMSDWQALPPATLSMIPKALRTLYRRGQRSGVIRKSHKFEVFYITALGSLTPMAVFARRFDDIRSRSHRQMKSLADQALNLLLDGITEGS